jgi:hypothetical protein
MTPQGMMGPPPSTLRPQQQDQVNIVGIVLMVIGSLTVLSAVASILLSVFTNTGANDAFKPMADDPSIPPTLRPFVGMLAGRGAIIISMITNLIHMALAGVMVLGGFQMRLLKNYGLSMAACICALVPCSCCCIITMPIGIWGLTVLTDRDVKAAFT